MAKTICWIGILICFFIGTKTAITDEELVESGIVIIVVGSIASWISSFILYGFGQLVENSDIIAKNISKDNHNSEEEQTDAISDDTEYNTSEIQITNESESDDDYFNY